MTNSYVPHSPIRYNERLTLGVSAGRGTNGRVSVAEARRAAKLILQVQVEVARFALVALLPFHVLLA